MTGTLFRHRAFALCLALAACHGQGKDAEKTPDKVTDHGLTIGIVTDVGGRGDQSFNDGALRGLEKWSAGVSYTAHGYAPLAPEAVRESIPPELAGQQITPLPEVHPLVLSSHGQEDYRPNLGLLARRHVALAIGVGFLLEDAVAAEARENPTQRYLLIDSPLLDAAGKPVVAPNVASVSFREQEGSFLAGVLAGLVTKGQVGFVGGMQVPLIRRFEAGFRAGVQAVNPAAAKALAVEYTGSFDDSMAGKRVAQSLYARGADVLFQAAGADGLGAIAAAEQAGKWIIGTDSDQSALAPKAVLTSMLKHVDLAVYLTVRDLTQGKFQAGNRTLGLAEGGVALAPVRVDVPDKPKAMAKVEAYRKAIVDGRIRVPATLEELAAFSPSPVD